MTEEPVGNVCRSAQSHNPDAFGKYEAGTRIGVSILTATQNRIGKIGKMLTLGECHSKMEC